jgi:acyl-CoA thioesterase-1
MLQLSDMTNSTSRTIIPFLLIALLSIPNLSRADEPSNLRTILVLGDSISAGYGIQQEQGWVALFRQQLKTLETDWTAVNASVSGETTGGGLARLPKLLEIHNPEIVLIELGGNDGLRGYPTAKLRKNLEAMVKLVKEQGSQPMIMAMRIPPNYGPRYTKNFDQVYSEVAAQSMSHYIPFFLNDVALQPGMMQQDGIHPTAVAQPTMADAVWVSVEPLLE